MSADTPAQSRQAQRMSHAGTSFADAVWRLRCTVFVLFGGLLCLSPGALFTGADAVAMLLASVWALVTRLHQPRPLAEALVATACTGCGVPDDHLAMAAGFTFGLCQIGLHGSRGVPGVLLFSAALFHATDRAAVATLPLSAGSGMLLGAGVIGVAFMAFGRQRSLRAAMRRLAARADRLARYLPELLTGRLGSDPLARCALERIWLVAVFIDMEGFTARSARFSLDRLEALVQDFVVAVTGAARVHRGVVMKLMGDGALVVFPANDQDERRNAAADALCFARRAVNLPIGGSTPHDRDEVSNPGLRAGVASGVCALGDWGASDVLDYSVIGLAVNLAERLQGAAPSGGVLMDAATARLLPEAKGRNISLWLHGLGPIMAVELGEVELAAG